MIIVQKGQLFCWQCFFYFYSINKCLNQNVCRLIKTDDESHYGETAVCSTHDFHLFTYRHYEFVVVLFTTWLAFCALEINSFLFPLVLYVFYKYSNKDVFSLWSYVHDLFTFDVIVHTDSSKQIKKCSILVAAQGYTLHFCHKYPCQLYTVARQDQALQPLY